MKSRVSLKYIVTDCRKKRLKKFFLTLPDLSLIMISLLSFFECIKRFSSLSFKEIKLIATAN